MIRYPVACLAVIAAFAATAESSGATPSGGLSPAAQTLSQCVQTNHELSALLLIDESGSLRTTDPLDQRVDGIRAALTGLAELADTPVSGRKPQVSVLMAGFYGIVHPDPNTDSATGSAWQTVDGSTIDALNEEASSYASLNVGRATDYATALLAAHRLFVEQAAEQTKDGGAAPCEALIWFTDGRYSIPLRVGKAGEGLPKTVSYAPNLRLDQKGAGRQAVAAGKSLMCRQRSGLMDDIANDGIVTFTVALSTQLSSADAAFLDAATTGSAGGQSCGADLSRRTGEYLTAGNGDRLFFAFGNLLGSSPPVEAKEVCPRLVCLRGTTNFTTVPGLSGFLIRASSGVEGAVLELSGPSGESVRLRPGAPTRSSLSGATVIQRWVSNRAVEVQGEFSPSDEAWIGRWSYAFIDPSASTDSAAGSNSYSSVQLYADLEPTILGKPSVTRGVPTEVKLGLASAAGSVPVSDGPLVRTASLTASMLDLVAGTTTSVPVVGPLADGTFTATLSVPNSSSASLLYLGLTANLATGGGTPIAPQYRSFSLPIRLPPGQGFPILSPSELHLPSVEGIGTAEGTIMVTGGPVGGGCAWVGSPTIEAPDDAGRVASAVSPSADSLDHCLRVDRGRSRNITIRLTPSAEATGTISASFPVHLRSNIVKGARVTSVPVTFVLVAPPDNTRRAVLLVVLILIGALLPLALLYALNVLGARFTAPQRLLVLAQDAEISHDGIKTETEPGFASFEPLSSDGVGRDVRDMDIDAVHLEAVPARSFGDLFGGPYGVATASDGGKIFASGSSGPRRERRGDTEQEVPLSLSGTWLFLPRDELSGVEGGSNIESDSDADLWGGDAVAADDPSSAVRGRLTLLISRSGDVNLGRELLADATQVLKEVDLREADDDDGAQTKETQSLRTRATAWIRKRAGWSDAGAVETQEDSELNDQDSEGSEEDPWA